MDDSKEGEINLMNFGPLQKRGDGFLFSSAYTTIFFGTWGRSSFLNTINLKKRFRTSESFK